MSLSHLSTGCAPVGDVWAGGEHGRAALGAPCGDAPAPSSREGGRKGRGSAVTPEGQSSVRGDSDSPWETERWQSWERSLALALPSSPPPPEHSAAWERAEAHRTDVLPVGSTRGRVGTVLPAPNRADAPVAPGQQLSLGAARLAGTPSSPQPGRGASLPKAAAKPPAFCISKKPLSFKGKRRSRWLGGKHQAAQGAVNRTGPNQALGREQQGRERDPLPKHHLSRLSHLPGAP